MEEDVIELNVFKVLKKGTRLTSFTSISANIYLLKVNIRNITKICQTCLKLTIKTPER